MTLSPLIILLFYEIIIAAQQDWYQCDIADECTINCDTIDGHCNNMMIDTSNSVITSLHCNYYSCTNVTVLCSTGDCNINCGQHSCHGLKVFYTGKGSLNLKCSGNNETNTCRNLEINDYSSSVLDIDCIGSCNNGTINYLHTAEFIMQCRGNSTCNQLSIFANNSNTVNITCELGACVQLNLYIQFVKSADIRASNRAFKNSFVYANNASFIHLSVIEIAFEGNQLYAYNANEVIIDSMGGRYYGGPFHSSFDLSSNYGAKINCYGFGCKYFAILHFNDWFANLAITVNGCDQCHNISECVYDWNWWWFYCRQKYGCKGTLNNVQFINNADEPNCNPWDDKHDTNDKDMTIWVVVIILCCIVAVGCGYMLYHKEGKVSSVNSAPNPSIYSSVPTTCAQTQRVEIVQISNDRMERIRRDMLHNERSYRTTTKSSSIMDDSQNYKQLISLMNEPDQTETKSEDFDTEYLIKCSVIQQQRSCDLQQCSSMMRINNILQRYHSLALKQINVNVIYNDVYNDKDVFLLNDFNHLLLDHSDEFESIHNAISSSNRLKCQLSDCLIIRRNLNNQRYNALYQECNNERIVVRQQFIDKIHSYYMHSFDIGYKLTIKDKENVIDGACINQLIEEKKKESFTNIDDLKIKQKNSKFTNAYDYGQRFFYWNYYKYQHRRTDPSSLADKALPGFDHLGVDTGMSLSFWYIEPNHDNFKSELLKNSICTISVMRWSQLWIKANMYIETEAARKIMLCPRKLSAKCFDMKFEEKMKTYHLMAVMLYCNFDLLSTKFSSTFRQIDSTENLFEFKARHTNYYYFARYLREAIECFGMKSPEQDHITLFHGTSQLFVFSSMNAYVRGPFSTTTDYAVAVNFSANEGMVLCLDMNVNEWIMQQTDGDDSLHRVNCWDCCWLSDFANEQEILFVGGLAKISINTIIEAPTGADYCEYIKGLKQMTYCMSNGDLWGNADIPKTRDERQMVFRLLSHELYRYCPNHKLAHQFKSCPEYFKNILHAHCENIQLIAFLNRNETSKIHDKLFTFDNGWIKLYIICKMFPNVQDIQFVAKEKHVSFFKNGSIFDSILVFIINKPIVLKGSKLESIVIFIDNSMEKEMTAYVRQYKEKFKRCQWRISMSHITDMDDKHRITILIWNWFLVGMKISIDRDSATTGDDIGFLAATGMYETRMFGRGALKLSESA